MTYGKLIACNDEWPFSDQGFEVASDTTTFLNNILGWFTQKSSAQFLVMSAGVAYHSRFDQAIQAAGHQVVHDNSENLDPSYLLSTYDGIFLAGFPVDNTPLIQYVNGGGCIYVAAGTTDDANRWNTLLETYDISFQQQNNNINGTIAINSGHPIFQNVTGLYMDNGNWVLPDGFNPDAQLIGNTPTEALFGVVQLTSVIRQPDWEDQVIKIEWAVDCNASFDCNPQEPQLNNQILGSFPGWFRVVNKANLPLSDVSIQISVSENSRPWDVSLKSHDPGDDDDRTVYIPNIPASGSQTVPTTFKWQVQHVGNRFDWNAFTVNLSLIPTYTVSYTEGWGPTLQMTATPNQTNN